MIIALHTILDWATCRSEEITKVQTIILVLISVPYYVFISGCTYTILVAY